MHWTWSVLVIKENTSLYFIACLFDLIKGQEFLAKVSQSISIKFEMQ